MCHANHIKVTYQISNIIYLNSILINQTISQLPINPVTPSAHFKKKKLNSASF